MSDTGQDITPNDTMSIKELEALRIDTQDRFYFEFTENPQYVLAQWRNYYKKSGKRVKKDGCYLLDPIQTKYIKIKVV